MPDTDHIPARYGYRGTILTPEELSNCCEVIRLLAATIKKEVDVRRDLGTAAALDEADQLDHDLDRLATTLAAREEMRPTVLACSGR